jgi:4-hydroxy-tetrahydrodipicolinate synthase
MANDSTKFRGVVVPMVSPFTRDGAIDEPAVGRIVEHLIAGRVAGIFPLGTTGEAMSIHPDDKKKLVVATVQKVAKRAVVYAGIASTCLRESIDAANAYKQLGVDAVVAHMPSYYPLSDADVEAYFRRLADSVPLPLLLYNIPVTTHHSIALGIVERLQSHPNIVALKDSANDAGRLTELFKMTGGRNGFPVLLGNSTQFTHGLKLGGVGLIPSGAHLVPELYQAMFTAAMENRWEAVEQLQKQTDAECAPYLKGRSISEALAGLKAQMEKRGLCSRMMLPPLRDHLDEGGA